MRNALLLFCVCTAFHCFFLIIDKNERCLIAKSKKDTEFLISLSVQDYSATGNFTVVLLIKEDETAYRDIRRFIFKNKPSETFIHYVNYSQEFFVCFRSQQTVPISIKFKQHSNNSTNAVSSEEMSVVDKAIAESTEKFAALLANVNETKSDSMDMLRVG